MELIVAGYVKVNDRRALTHLLAQRGKVLAQLQAVSDVNLQNVLEAIQVELKLIEAGLRRLDRPTSSLPENK